MQTALAHGQSFCSCLMALRGGCCGEFICSHRLNVVGETLCSSHSSHSANDLLKHSCRGAEQPAGSGWVRAGGWLRPPEFLLDNISSFYLLVVILGRCQTTCFQKNLTAQHTHAHVLMHTHVYSPPTPVHTCTTNTHMHTHVQFAHIHLHSYLPAHTYTCVRAHTQSDKPVEP